ncbi:MAG TPA: dihydrofolate reductase family protein [Actinomycetes bacterium]|nr:dihydrofolate reductase family protein [Actinomycetes bacterium]
MKLVVSEFISMDGVIEAPGGGEDFEHGGWTFGFEQGPDGEQFKFEEVMKADALLLGRVTYEGFAQAWPSMTDAGEFGDKMNGMPKYVASTTLDKADWNNSTVISGDVAGEVARLKRQPGGDLLVNGSSRLVQTLMEHDLVDEYRLMVFPIVLGGGKRLFGDGSAKTTMRLVEQKPVGPDGVLVLTYRPARNQAEQA